VPTYKNTTLRPINVNGVKVGVGEKIEDYRWLSVEGLERQSDFPQFNPTVWSGYIDPPKGEILIPERISRYAIHFYVERGYPVIYFNTTNNRPPLRLYPNARWNVRCYERIVSKLIIYFEDEFDIGRLWVIIEKI